tara:strand:- start:25194 stop:25799 length:606 start_codon:yes stop_codon:yes gene_type:complete
MTRFKAHTRQEHQRALAQYLPSGIKAKINPNSNLYKLLDGFGGELTRIDELFEDVFKQLNILTTDNSDYMSLWESLLGLPDDIFPQTDSLTIAERREQVLLKLRGLGALTEQDFIDLAALLGIVITIEHGIDNAYPPYNVPFYPISENGARFIMIIKGSGLFNAVYPPYNIPFFPTAENSQITKLFEKLKPSNTKILFINN